MSLKDLKKQGKKELDSLYLKPRPNGLPADIEEMSKRFKLKREISFEARLIKKNLFWLKVSATLFIIELIAIGILLYTLTVIK